MRVTFHGVRGSCPTPGPSTVRYGGNTSCVEVELVDGTVIVLDAGTGIRQLGRRLTADGRVRGPFHLFITHVHWDHIIGLPFFAPIYVPEATIVMHPIFTDHSHVLAHDDVFDGLHFPLRLHELPAKLIRPEPQDGPTVVGSAHVTRTPLNHPGGATGIRVEDADGALLVFLTDNELVPRGPRAISPLDLASFAEGADLMIHDAQYVDADMPAKVGWGHSTVTQVLELGRNAGVRRLALYHHDPDRTDVMLDRIGEDARTRWRESGSHGEVIVASEGLSLDVRR